MKYSKIIGLFFTVNVLLFACMLIVRWPWIMENFLVGDDLIVIPKAIADQGSWSVSGFAQWFILNNALEFYKNVAKVRFLYLGLFTISASYLYFALRRLINDNIYPLLILLVASLFPVYVDQAIFINGSHPLLGMVFVLTATASLIYLTLSETKKMALVWFILAVFLFFVSLYCSPTTAIVSLGGMILLLYPMPRENIFFKRILLISSSILPPLLKQLHLRSLGTDYNHYSRMEGWTIITPDNMVTQLTRSIKIIFNTIGWQLVIVIASILVVALIVRLTLNAQNKTTIKKKEFLVLLFFFFTLSGLYFAPISILANVQLRYLVGPIFFSILALGVALYIICGVHKHARNFLIVGLCVICVLLINVSKDYATQRFSFSAERQKTIRSFVKEKVAEWKPDSQVILVLNKMPPGFTYGYNHWSTWHLRYITNRTDIIGLIGHNSWLKYNPIIKKYRDHGSEFWTTVETNTGRRMARKQMIGIEENRPTYIYVEQKDGSFVQYDQILVFENDKYQIFSADKNGLALLSNKLFDFKDMCSVLGKKRDTTLIFGSPTVEPYVPSEHFNKLEVLYDGKTFHKLKIPKWKYVNIEMDISSSSSGDIQYLPCTEVSPPMPFLWGAIAIYQVGPNTYRIGNSTIVEKNNSALINIKVFDKCGYLVNSSDGNASFSFGNFFSDSPLIVGRGFKNRYWKGKFNSLKITITDQNDDPIILTTEDIKRY